jgi:4-carboxymuconolactone decarboxylase
MAETERFKTLTEAEMTPEQKKLVQAIIAGPRKQMRGGPFQAFLRSPELGDIVQQFGAHVRFKSIFPDTLKELAILVTARHWTAQYEWQAHRRMAVEAGLNPAIPDTIAQGKRPQGLSADETAVYDFASELLRTGEVGDKNFDAIKSRWGERGVVELILTVGYYTTVSMILNVHRHPIAPDQKPLEKLPK